VSSYTTLFRYVEAALAEHGRTCLTCMRYKTTESGLYLRCAVRPCTYQPVDSFDEEAAALTYRRAAKCKHWDPDDD